MILKAGVLKNHYRARTWVEDEFKRSIALAPTTTKRMVEWNKPSSR